MVKPFAKVTSRTQINRLRGLARRALPAWGLAEADLRLLVHGYNTTFRVDTTDGRRFALRVNTQPHKTAEHLCGEVAWLAALSAETDLHVPTPQPTRAGELSATIASPDHERPLPMVLFSWLDGPNLGSSWTKRQARTAGAAMATLHNHAETWPMPAGAWFSNYRSVLTDVPNRLGDHPALNAEASTVLLAALEATQRLQDEVFAAGPIIALHADLHGENLKWHQGRLGIFDFDDAGLGPPGLDLSISAYYLRLRLMTGAEEALRAGYETVRPLPRLTTEQLDGMIAGRNVLLINDVIQQPNAALQSMVPSYVERSVKRMRIWLDTGEFRRE